MLPGEHRYRELIEGMNEGVIALDRNRVITYSNARMCEMWGRSSDELVGHSFSDFLDAQTDARLQERWRRRQVGDREQFETTLRRPDGTEVEVLASPQPLFDATGAFDGSMTVVTDITARKQAESALRSHAQRFRTLFEAPFEAIAISENGIIRDSNARFAEMLGYTKEEVVGMSVASLVAPESRDTVLTAIHEGRTLAYEHYAMRKDGTKIWVEASGKPIDMDGRAMRVTALRDVTGRKQARDELERRVAERTQELLRANTELQQEIEDRRRAEDALRVSEKRFRSLCAFAPIGIFLSDVDGMTVYVNSHLMDLCGLSLAQCVGRGWLQCVHPEDRDMVAGESSRSPKRENGFDHIFRICTPTGVTRWVHARTAQFLSDDGVRQGSVGTVQDITEQREAQQRIRESEERFDAILNNGTAVTYVKDVEGRYLLINRQYERLFHVSKQDVLGKTDFDLFPVEMARAFRKNDLEVLAANESIVYEEVAPHDDGPHDYISSKFTLRDASGKPYATGGISTDITEIRRAEKALRESERYNRTLFDLSPIGLALCRMDGSLLDINPAYARIMGRSVAETLKLSYWDITPEKYRDQELRILDQLKRTGRYGPFEKEYIHRDGRLVPVRLSGLILEKNGEPLIWSSVEDISQRRLAEEQARLHQVQLVHVARVSTMGEMMSVLAHEINQPLAAIANFAQGCVLRLEAGVSDASTLLQPLKEITGQAARAGAIIRRLRDFVRKTEPKRTRLDINSIVGEAACFAEPEARRSAIQMRLTLCDVLPEVFVDAIQIEQVILNLLRNAIEAVAMAGVGGSVTVSTSMGADQSLIVSVCDTGPGLDADELANAFEPFVTTKPDGMGMGLPICKTLVESHGGRLWATANDDRGMTFHFALPAADERSAP